MVSKSNVIEVNSKCICGLGDTEHAQKNYFENKCPNCGKEGTLKVETENNMEISSEVDKENNSESTNNTDTTTSTNDKSSSLKIVCDNCRTVYCGQDGYDKEGGRRASLNSVNPNEITDDEEDGEASTTDEETENKFMSGWEGLCDLIKPLDGQAMIVQRGDYVVVKKIDMPQSASLWAYEGINVVDDSVSITDYTPEIYNTFIIRWGETFENELEFTINKHKKLFGERKIIIEAKKVQVVGEGEESDEESSNTSGGGLFDWLGDSNPTLEDADTSNLDTKNLTNKNLNTNNVDTSNIDTNNIDNNTLSEENSDSEESDAPETEEVPITTKEEAMQFGLTQVGKAKREDGHTIELKVIGNTKWQMGEWCHVRLPSFNEDSYMFISKCSFESSPDNEFIHSLTLVDYPPSLGKPSKKKETDENQEDTESDSDSDTNDTNNSDSDTNSDSNSNASDSSSDSSSNSSSSTTG